MVEKMKDVSVILPTYNEKENLPLVIKEIDEVLRKKFDYEIIVVDDNSPDGTSNIAKELSKKYPIKVIIRPKKLGLASAVLTGFLNSGSDILVAMDADCQHEPSILPQMINLVKNGYELVIGSRYISGGDIDENWGKKRKLTSNLATFAAKFLIKGIKDPMSGFFAIKKDVIKRIKDWKLCGYKILLEILAKSNVKKMTEVPIRFSVRKFGETKLNWKELLNFGRLLFHLYWWKIKGRLLCKD